MKCSGCKEMPARYLHTLTVEKPRAVEDASGQVDLDNDLNWVTVGQIKANFITRGGSESHVFKQVTAETTTVIKTPSSNLTRQLDPTWRLRWGGRKFNIITGYLINETGRVYQIEASERRQP